MAFAEEIKNVKTTRIAMISDPTFGGVGYTSVGGISTDNDKHSMFVCKSSSTEQYAALFYFPDITNSTTREEYYIYRLAMAGHANGMAIDNDAIYITGWVDKEDNRGEGNQDDNTYNNWIIEVPLNVFDGLPKTKTGEKISTSKYNVYKPEYINETTNEYEEYTAAIMSITKYKNNNADGSSKYFGYRMARLETDSKGIKHFVVSTDFNGRFAVENNMETTDTTGQDLCYSPYTGLLIAKWCKSALPCKNVILRVDIDNASYTTKTIGGKSYKCYTPDNIIVDHSETNGRGVKKYTKFEIESIAVSKNKRILISCNVAYTNAFEIVYENETGTSVGTDGVFKLTYSDGSKILL